MDDMPVHLRLEKLIRQYITRAPYVYFECVLLLLLPPPPLPLPLPRPASQRTHSLTNTRAGVPGANASKHRRLSVTLMNDQVFCKFSIQHVMAQHRSILEGIFKGYATDGAVHPVDGASTLRRVLSLRATSVEDVFERASVERNADTFARRRLN